MTLQDWMERADVGTSELARQLGISPQAVVHLKKQRRGASIGVAAKLEALTKGAVTAKDLVAKQRRTS